MELLFLLLVVFGVYKYIQERNAQREEAFTSPDAIYLDAGGYLRYHDSDRLVHRAVVGQKLGRRLRPLEVVHHRDRNKQNNHPGNLWVFKAQAAHDAQHRRDAVNYGEWWSYNGSSARGSN